MKKIQPYLEKIVSILKKALLHTKIFLKKIWLYAIVFLEKIPPFARSCWQRVKPYLEKARPYVEKAQAALKKALIWAAPYVRKGLPYAVVALLSVTVTLAVTLAVIPPQRQPTKLDILGELIMNRFIGEKDQTAMQDAAADAMVAALGDRWSYYIPAEFYAKYLEESKNVYVGIGITFSPRTDGLGLDVLDVTQGGPAQEAGILKGDVITAVNETVIEGMDVNEAKKMIQGEAGTTVKLTLLRAEAQLQLDVTRREIKTPVAKAQMLDGQIGLVTIVNFNANCAEETIAAIEQLISDGAKKLIFDVRNNIGGYASEMVAVLDRLLPEGKLFTAVDYAGMEMTDMSDENCLNMPMAVLINEKSYSAAEFFAAAMDEYDAAVLVGEKTIGKGYFQNDYLLPDGSAVNLSIGKYYTPKGNSLTDVGIMPEVMVPVNEKIASQIAAGTLEPMQDPQVLAAIEALN